MAAMGGSARCTIPRPPLPIPQSHARVPLHWPASLPAAGQVLALASSLHMTCHFFQIACAVVAASRQWRHFAGRSSHGNRAQEAQCRAQSSGGTSGSLAKILQVLRLQSVHDCCASNCDVHVGVFKSCSDKFLGGQVAL